MRTHFDDYKDKFEFLKLKRDDRGVIEIRMHTNDKELEWGFQAHEEVAQVWDDVSRDPDNRVLILTGTGDEFIDTEILNVEIPEGQKSPITPEIWHHVAHVGKRLCMSHLDVEVPMIAAVNGHARIHAEQALLCDIIIGADDFLWGDSPHFPAGLVPGDGVQMVWPLAIGFNRARYMMLTGKNYTSQEMVAFGGIGEAVPQEQVLSRAYELADKLLQSPDLTVRSSRQVMVHEIKPRLDTATYVGLSVEGLAAIADWPFK